MNRPRGVMPADGRGIARVRLGATKLAIAGARPRLPSLYQIAWWALAAVIALLGAALFWAIVTPVSSLGQWTAQGVRTMSPTARAALFASVDPFNRTAPGPAAAEQSGAVTSLALTLFATRAMADGSGTAIIAGGDGQQQVYRVGAEVQPGVTLAAVAFDHVELSRNGAKELLYLDQSGPAPTAQGVVAANPVAAPPANAPGGGVSVAALRSGVNFGPRAEGGKVVGVEVLSSGDGSAFRAAGFQPGDVITEVNGKPVAGPGDAAMLSGAIRAGTSIAVTVRRGDRQLPLAITLAP